MAALLLGQVFPMSQWLTYSILIGSNRHQLVGVLALAEFGAVCALSIIGVKFAGLIGACAAVAVAAFWIRGLGQMLAGCRLIHVSVMGYTKQVFVPVCLAAIFPIAALRVCAAMVAPRTFVAIGALGMGYSVLFAFVVGVALLGFSGLKSAVRLAVPRFERLG